MNSPTKGRGRLGSKRNPPPESSESQKPKPRKRKPVRKKINRPKQRGRYQPKTQTSTDDALPPVGVRDPDLAECIFSDEEERNAFLEECPQDLPPVESPPSLPPESASPLVSSCDFERDVTGEGSVSFVFLSPGDGISDESEDPSHSGPMSSEFSSQPHILQSISSEHAYASESSATDQGEVQSSPVPVGRLVHDENSASETSDVLQSSATRQSGSDSVNQVTSSSAIGDEAAPSTSLILKAVEQFRNTLPPKWVPIGDRSGFHLFRFSTKTPSAVQREIFLPFNDDPKIFVHCKTLPWELDLLKSVKGSKVFFNIDSIDQFCSWGVSISRILEQYSICIGADLVELKDVWGNIPDSTVDKNPYQEEKYSETCRSTSCSLLIPLGKGKRCAPCSKVLISLKNRRCQLLSKDPHRSTPNIYLTYPQALQKLKMLNEEIRKKDAKIAYLEGKCRDLLDREGVDVDENLSTDLANILANSNLTREQEIFFREQFNCSGKADPRAHRWHPYMIRLALHLQMTSRAAYEALRKSGAVKLPSSRTLYQGRTGDLEAGLGGPTPRRRYPPPL